MSPKVHTVSGLIDSEKIGVTLTHEHLTQNSDVYLQKGKTPELQWKSVMPWSLENVHWIRQFP